MKIKGIELCRSSFSFKIPKRQLIEKDFDTKMRLRWKKSEGKLPIPKKSRIECRSITNGSSYSLGISFRPSIELSKGLVDGVVKEVNISNGLTLKPFNNGHDLCYVIPSGLVHLTDKWMYADGWYQSLGAKKPENRFRVRIKFPGKPDNLQIQKLREMVDEVYLPERGRGDRWGIDKDTLFIEYDPHGMMGCYGSGLSYPVVAVDKIFSGDITREAEKEISEFYNQIRDFVIKNGLAERCYLDEKDIKLTNHVRNEEGINLQEQIATATFKNKNRYVPRIEGVAAFQPTGDIIYRIIGKGSDRAIHETMDLIKIKNTQYTHSL